MFNLKELANNKDYYLKMFTEKGYFLTKEFDLFLDTYKKYSDNLIIEENDRNKLNSLSKKIAKDASLKVEAKKLSEKIKIIADKNKNYLFKIKEIVSFFPNIFLEDVPLGKDEKENVVIAEIKQKNYKKTEIFHLDILKQKNLILEKEASFLSGRRHVIYKNEAAQFIFALEQFMIDFNLKKKYLMIDCPIIVNEKMLYNTAQLPKFKDDLFELKNKQFLIPTAEVPLTNLAANKIFKKEQLPLKYFALTNCFRKEVASAGKDTKGIIRLHQFRKIEIVKIGLKANYLNDFQEMLDLIKELLDQFEISYRLVNLCTGDLPFASKKTIDFEIWFPHQKKYREISSLSLIGNFQALRMNARVILENNKKESVYTYNGSALAIDRLFAAIVENYYQKDGSIIVPKVLKKYLNFEKF
ncbi:/ serS / Serine--tRNA ligase /:647389 Reverse [Candidatus Hepatoplasma crinochetorum]|uniref:Serine--tRNA ligase n=1 Tax=Candidatus Hepatoplasma crinochetorum TaxID=295596 RepID=A0A0G7ZLU8_9MOLU|nr:/ serS / Serine--tRNA ligase /:647389 Reverse [Candidatus Hepatoplasma crinochetorum]